MARRTVTALLWLLAVWTVFNALSVYAGVPAWVGPAAGLAVAALVWWDPSGRLWQIRAARAAARRRLADLPRVSQSPTTAPELRRETETTRG